MRSGCGRSARSQMAFLAGIQLLRMHAGHGYYGLWVRWWQKRVGRERHARWSFSIFRRTPVVVVEITPVLPCRPKIVSIALWINKRWPEVRMREIEERELKSTTMNLKWNISPFMLPTVGSRGNTCLHTVFFFYAVLHIHLLHSNSFFFSLTYSS